MMDMQTAYKCRAYPNLDQAALFGRTFGCGCPVSRKTLAERRRAYEADGNRTTYKQTDATLTTRKQTAEPAFPKEVFSVPLQQALRRQHAAFAEFFAGRACYPRCETRTGRQAAHCTRSAFRMEDGRLRMAKTTAPLEFVWSFEKVGLATLNPTMVVVSRDPDGR